MGIEIERKFLTISDHWRLKARSPKRLVQGYLSTARPCTVRVRSEHPVDPVDPVDPLVPLDSLPPSGLNAQGRAWITIKGPVQCVTRSEFEYEIPVSEAAELLTQFCRDSTIDKVRHLVDFDGTTWEVDEFQGNNLGLIVAEVTLSHESEKFSSPGWLGLEVSHDPRYFNSNLSKHPFKDWAVEKTSTTKIPSQD